MPNQFGVNYSFPGLCSLCHREIAEFEGSRQIVSGIFRPIIKRILGIARTAEIKLDDKSNMTVALCKFCYNNLKPEDMQPLMESEINGWQHEVDEIAIRFDLPGRIKYMRRYSKRFAIARVDKRWTNTQRLLIKKPRRSKLKVRTR